MANRTIASVGCGGASRRILSFLISLCGFVLFLFDVVRFLYTIGGVCSLYVSSHFVNM